MRVFKYLLVATLLLGIVVKPASIFAASAVDLSTSPLPISLTTPPGTTISTDIRIKNNSDTQKVKVSLMKFSAYGDEGKPALKEREKGDDYFDWVSFSPATFTAPTGQWMTIKMTIQVPEKVGFGYYYAAIFTPENGKPVGKGNILLGSTAVLVLLDVQNPNAKRTMQIASLQSNKRVYEFLPATFNVKLHNSGNVHLRPHGNIYISHGKKQVATLILNNQEGSILPGTNRIYKVNWNDGFPNYVDKKKDGTTVVDKLGNTEKTLRWKWTDLSKFRFGRYTAHLTAVYDNGNQDVPLDATVGFWVIPWRIIGGFLLIFGLVGFGLWSSVLKPIMRRVKRSK